MSVLSASGLARRFAPDAPAVLEGVSFTLARGEFVAVAGPSGSGKSTLLAILGGLDRPSAGQVLLEGEDLYARSADALAQLRAAAISFVFQSHNLVPTLTALENVALAVRSVRGTKAQPWERARQALAALCLESKVDRLPFHLSLGEQQRVAVARAIAVAPKVLLADEPTASLDGAHGERVLDAFAVLQRDGCAVVLASHDDRCLKRADRICHLLDGRVHA